ncbi:MAG: alpha-L-fucosidase [Fimbriimonas sp.]|nr:alpha-L-fucosidase [Fimbriimonas sp.]
MRRPPRPSAETIAKWQGRRFGLFIHWGLYSTLGGTWNGQRIDGYNEQIQAHARIPKDEYEQLASQFNPLEWDPDMVASLAADAGMKFVVITSKHHDGFSLFHTGQTGYNVVDATPYGRDVVAELSEACARKGLDFGVYFSTIDWHYEGATPIDYDPLSGIRNDNEIPDVHARFNAAQLSELMSNYGPISEVWFDMGKPSLDQSILFADTVHRLQPETMVSGRVFNYQGDFTVMGDNEIPSYPLGEPWQSPASIFHETWGYRSWQERPDVVAKTREHICNLVRVVSRGGNYLLNIGPRGDGSIVEFEAEVLLGIGDWLAKNREAIEDTEPQPFRHLDFGAATYRGQNLFLFVLDWPEDGAIRLPGLETEILSARFAGCRELPVGVEAGFPKIEVGPETGERLPAIVKVELAEPPVVRHRSVHPDSDGSLFLFPVSGDAYYHRNGYGYSDPPRLHRLQWLVSGIEPGSYTVSGKFQRPGDTATVQISIGEHMIVATVPDSGSTAIQLGQVQLASDTLLEVRISPPMPYEKGVALGAIPIHISLMKNS